MTRGRNKVGRRQVRVVWITWSPAVAGLFRLVPADWTPPAQVKVHRGVKQSTWKARFTTPAGDTATALARIRLDRLGENYETRGETLSFHFGGPRAPEQGPC
ncbi:MAG: hypothetical protein Q8K93_10825 [Reyranella sp.]|uniref:hypothetical protein n=1 Tax=Reyranella sp. TaxID=1929291 RepID=UPI00272F1E09|nr:hypothetical protein [Reyranella sp.]MDP1962680.1 hypothetical protein [Reyranella sp.]MDP2376554.1 hypothetical protein [Reyranella sp.]